MSYSYETKKQVLGEGCEHVLKVLTKTQATAFDSSMNVAVDKQRVANREKKKRKEMYTETYMNNETDSIISHVMNLIT